MAKRWVYAAIAIPVIGIAVVVAAAWSFDANSQKARIAEAVYRATGRELTLAGPVRLGWSLTPTLEAEDVSFANMPGGTRPAMATAARVEAQIRLWPLLFHKVELTRVTLVRPDILIETDATGRGNWQFDRPAVPASTSPATPSAPGTRTTTVLDNLRIEAGRVTWHDGVTGRTLAADVSQATMQGGEGPLHLVAAAQTGGAAITLDATLGTAAQLTQAVSWPVRLIANVGDATVTITGIADPAARTLSGRVEATVPDLARLGTLLQYPDWPPLHDIQLAATLPAAGGLPQDVSLRIGAADLGRLVPGASLGTLTLAWPAGQAARLVADGSLGGAPWHFATGLVPAGQGVALRGLSVTSAVGDLAGDMAVTVAPRPALRGTLVSNRLDWDAVRSIPRPSTPATASTPVPAPAPASARALAQLQAAPQSRIFSDAPLPWSVLRQADADLQLSVGTLHAGGADYRSLAAHAVLQDGVLRIDPASVQMPEGRVDASASADSRQAVPPVALVLRSAAFALDPLAQAFGLPGGSEGSAELDIALQAAGTTPHALAASLTGHVGIALVDGEVSNAALSAALGDLLRSAGTRFDSTGRSHVRCLAVRADAKAGQVTLSALTLDTSRLALDGSGTIDLADESMALRLRPTLRLGGTGVSAPMRVDGTLRHHVVALDSLGGAGRVGVVIGGPGAADTCTPALTAARDGRAGPLPAESAAVKSVKPADLLRSFLR